MFATFGLQSHIIGLGTAVWDSTNKFGTGLSVPGLVDSFVHVWRSMVQNSLEDSI
jgi:hypothetical protein